MLNPFEAATKLLNKRDADKLKFDSKMNLFFIDYIMMPMLIHENYLSTQSQTRSLEDVQKMNQSADYISFGDCINSVLRTEGAWDLLPNMAICSTIAPANLCAGNLSLAKFPQMLGKNMILKKTNRQIKEIASDLAGKLSIPSDSLLNDAIPQIFGQIVTRVLTQFDQKMKEAIDIMDYFGISLDHFKENFLDLCSTTEFAKKYNDLPASTKSSFTKMYNKSHQGFSKQNSSSKKSRGEPIRDKIDPDFDEHRENEDQENSFSESSSQQNSDNEMEDIKKLKKDKKTSRTTSKKNK